MNPIIMYENYLTEASSINVSSTDSNPVYNKANLYDYRPYTFWKTDSTSDQGVEVNFASNKSITAIGIINHNLNGCIITLKKVIDAVETTIIGWTQSGNENIFKTFTAQSAPQFKLYISTAGGKQIGLLMLGNYITFPYPPNTPYAPYEEAIVAENAISEGGYLLGSTVKYNPKNLNATFEMIPQTWVTASFVPFWAHAKSLKPFIYAWNITDYPNEILFVWIKPDSIMKYEKSLSSYVDVINLSMVGV